jgi:hypothetical protein
MIGNIIQGLREIAPQVLADPIFRNTLLAGFGGVVAGALENARALTLDDYDLILVDKLIPTATSVSLLFLSPAVQNLPDGLKMPIKAFSGGLVLGAYLMHSVRNGIVRLINNRTP